MIPVPVIIKNNIRARIHRSYDTRSKAVVRENSLCDIGSQNGIAQNHIPAFYLLCCQVVGQMPWADDFNTVIVYENPYLRVNQIIPVYKSIDQRFFQNNRMYFRNARGIYALTILYFMQITHDKGITVLIDFLDSP